MSAILDALKKLEAETASPGTGGVTEGSFTKSSRARPVFVIAGGVVIFLVFAAGIWKLATLSVNPTVTDTRAAKTRVRLDLPARDDGRSQQAKQSPGIVLAQADPASGDTDAAEPDAGKPESGSSDESGSAAESESQAGGKQSGKKARQQIEKPPETGDSQARSAPDKTETRQNPVSNGSAQPDTAPEPEIMEDGPLTLQAISWADAPENRIAVINGKICRQGERIDGYRIQAINPDDVRVTDGEKTWRLSFGIR
ncbi:MAG: general secretion pathway protein GspB [Desulfobacteraceae bacterium]|nr:general secretion pathway protein GspB [Desulfobacteraceae bacterium]